MCIRDRVCSDRSGLLGGCRAGASLTRLVGYCRNSRNSSAARRSDLGTDTYLSRSASHLRVRICKGAVAGEPLGAVMPRSVRPGLLVAPGVDVATTTSDGRCLESVAES